MGNMNRLDFRIVLALLIVIIIQIIETYNVQCPSGNQWYLRAVSLCHTLDKYVCLYDDNNHIWDEQCKGIKSATTGTKQTFNNRNFNKMPCSNDTYQPFPFSTINSSDCVYQKYICAEEGSIPYDNGTHKTDRKCRCDYTKNYAFISKLANSCHCDPTKEDCSCCLKLCGAGEKLSQDYECIQESNEAVKQFKCEAIELLFNGLKGKDDDILLDSIVFTKDGLNAKKESVFLIGIIVCFSFSAILLKFSTQIIRKLMAFWQSIEQLELTCYPCVVGTTDEDLDDIHDAQYMFDQFLLNCDQDYCQSNRAVTSHKKNVLPIWLKAYTEYNASLTAHVTQTTPTSLEQEASLTAPLTPTTPTSLEREASLKAPLTPTTPMSLGEASLTTPLTPTSPKSLELENAEVANLNARTELIKMHTELLKTLIEKARQTEQIKRGLTKHKKRKKILTNS